MKLIEAGNLYPSPEHPPGVLVGSFRCTDVGAILEAAEAYVCGPYSEEAITVMGISPSDNQYVNVGFKLGFQTYWGVHWLRNPYVFEGQDVFLFDELPYRYTRKLDQPYYPKPKYIRFKFYVVIGISCGSVYHRFWNGNSVYLNSIGFPENSTGEWPIYGLPSLPSKNQLRSWFYHEKVIPSFRLYLGFEGLNFIGAEMGSYPLWPQRWEISGQENFWNVTADAIQAAEMPQANRATRVYIDKCYPIGLEAFSKIEKDPAYQMAQSIDWRTALEDYSVPLMSSFPGTEWLVNYGLPWVYPDPTATGFDFYAHVPVLLHKDKNNMIPNPRWAYAMGQHYVQGDKGSVSFYNIIYTGVEPA